MVVRCGTASYGYCGVVGRNKEKAVETTEFRFMDLLNEREHSTAVAGFSPLRPRQCTSKEGSSMRQVGVKDHEVTPLCPS